MKKVYESPEFEVEKFTVTDTVITTSTSESIPDQGYGDETDGGDDMIIF